MITTLDLGVLHANRKSAEDATTRRALSSLSLVVAKSKRAVVVTGAGISCSCGIPDFRSSDGLYALVKSRYPDVVMKGRDLFDAALFRDPQSTALFYTFISGLKSSIDKATPSRTHDFIKTLDSKGKLVRSYTQNIDGLEERSGLLGSSSEKAKGKGKNKILKKEVKNVQLHGDIHRVRCMICSAEFPCIAAYMQAFQEGDAPDCPDCVARCEARVARSARPLKVGTLRPAIVLYDEPHPLGDEIADIQTTDLIRKPDLLIIMGTSLKVHGLKRLVKEFAKVVHSSKTPGKVIFVNLTPPAGEWAGVIDYHVMGPMDTWADKVIDDWKTTRPADWEIQQTLTSPQLFKTVKGSSAVVSKPKGKENNLSHAGSLAVGKNRNTIPLSPSKRQNTSDSHYSDSEGSPRKKRDVTSRKGKSVLAENERGLLFNMSKKNSNTRWKRTTSQTSTVVHALENLDFSGSPMKLDGQDVFNLTTPIKKQAWPPTKKKTLLDADVSMISAGGLEGDVIPRR